MNVIFQHRIYRNDLQNNPHYLYLFGDNDHRLGLGGQAGQCRGEPNAVGIATKISPSNHDSQFLSDDNYKQRIDVFAKEIAVVLHKFNKGGYKGIVIPSDGLGTGLSEMPTRCPKLYEALNTMLAAAFGELPWTN